MSNILITTSSFGKFDDSVIRQIEEKGLTIVSNSFGRTLTEEEVRGLINEYKPVGMIAGVEPLTSTVLEESGVLKVISRCGIGMSNVDIAFAEGKNIKVLNTPDAPTLAVAELTVSMILAMLRRLGEADRTIRRGSWEKLMGRLLSGMTVGIIGCGRIGNKVAEYLSVFGCEVVGYDPDAKESNKINMVEIERLQKESDIVSLHVPLNDGTANMIDGKFISGMKDGSFLVNVSRGGIVEEEALLEALKSGKLSGAAFDTFEKEPYEGPLSDIENIILSAHMGSYAREARIGMEIQAVDNLLSNLI